MCLDLRSEENENVDTPKKILIGMCVEICNLKKMQSEHTFRKSRRTEIIGGFHLMGH